MIDMQVLKEIAAEQYTVMVEREHGHLGVVALRGLLQSLDVIYQSVSPETLTNQFVVFKVLEGHDISLPVDEAVRVVNPRYLSEHLHGTVVIQVLDNKELLVWRGNTPNSEQLAQTAVVYVYDDKIERIYAKDSSRNLKNPVPTYPSCFAIPTFSDLSFALQEYKVKMVQHCSCYLLADAWMSEKRLFLKPGQEHVMRRSLVQFLRGVLRGNVEVRPEQNVDETHPVDIKVIWELTNRRAIIEIKWLGKSQRDDGIIVKNYTEVRARDGAKQLSEYLDASHQEAPVQITRGYLVVFDARRYRLNDDSVTIDVANGSH